MVNTYGKVRAHTIRVPYTALLYSTVYYSGTHVLPNKRISEVIYYKCGTVRHTVRNGHKTVPAHCLHCTVTFLTATIIKIMLSVLYLLDYRLHTRTKQRKIWCRLTIVETYNHTCIRHWILDSYYSCVHKRIVVKVSTCIISLIHGIFRDGSMLLLSVLLIFVYASVNGLSM